MPTPASLDTPCTQHPQEAAGWTCTSCHSALCPRCAGTRKAASTDYVVCCLCGGATEPIRIPRAQLSYVSRLARAWRYPLNRNGLVSMLAAGFITWALSRGLLGTLIANCAVCAYIFSLVRAVGNGSTEIEPPDFTDWGDIVWPGLRGFVATSFIWLPMGLYAAYGLKDVVERLEVPPAVSAPKPVSSPDASGSTDEPAGGEAGDEAGEMGPEAEAAPGAKGAPTQGALPMLEAEVEPGAEAPKPKTNILQAIADHEVQQEAERAAKRDRMLRAPPVWLIFLIGLFFVPMALLLAATGAPIVEILNPLRLIALIRRIPNDYAIAVGAILMLGVLYFISVALGFLVRQIPLYVLPGILGNTLTFYIPFVTAYVLGSLLWLRGTELGCFSPDEAFILALPGGEPQGTPPPLKEELPPDAPVRKRAISLEIPVVQVGNAPRTAEPRRAVTPAERILEALRTHQPYLAVSLYTKATTLSASDMSGPDHYEIARAAAAQGDYPAALRALQLAAAADPSAPLAPQAFMMMGRILSERVGDQARATRVFQHLVQHYPNSEGARFARRQLATGRS